MKFNRSAVPAVRTIFLRLQTIQLPI